MSDAVIRRRLSPADRAVQLRRVAEATFAELGFHAATMDDIALRADVSRTILYRHYPTKDALAAACLARARERLEDLVESAADQASTPSEALTTITNRILDFMSERSQLYRVFVADAAFTGTAAHDEAELVRANLEQHVCRLLREHCPALSKRDATIAASSYIGGVERTAQMLAGPGGGAKLRRAASVLVTLLLAGAAALVADG